MDLPVPMMLCGYAPERAVVEIVPARPRVETRYCNRCGNEIVSRADVYRRYCSRACMKAGSGEHLRGR